MNRPSSIKIYLSALLLSVSGVFSSCDKDEAQDPPITDQDCLDTNGAAGQIIEGEYIVTTPSSSSGRSKNVARILADNKINTNAIIGNFEGEKLYHVLKLSKDELQRLEADESIDNIEPDRVISACGCFTVVEPRLITWNVNQVGYGDGTGKTAWIIDTGIDANHPDLNVDESRSKSFLQGVTSFEDDNGHGTHIGGIIGALNNNFGTLGVASGTSLVGLKVLDLNGDGKLSGLLNALTYVKGQAKSGDVVNISIGFPDESKTLENEIQAIANKGVYFTLAAGNESTSASTYSPGRTAGKNIYTVTAVDSLKRFASFSNYGNDVIDYAAPGVRILSTYKDGKYAILSGTSMAAPHVAGILLINNGKVNSIGSATGDPDGTPDPLAHQ
jgi:subtilisin